MHPVLFSIDIPLIVLQILVYGGAIVLPALYSLRALKTLPKEEAKGVVITAALIGGAVLIAAFKFLHKEQVGDPFKLTIHTYGLMIALGFLIGMQLALRE